MACMPLAQNLKGAWNEKFGLKETLLFERTFEVTKIGLYVQLLRIAFQSWDISICLICK